MKKIKVFLSCFVIAVFGLAFVCSDEQSSTPSFLTIDGEAATFEVTFTGELSSRVKRASFTLYEDNSGNYEFYPSVDMPPASTCTWRMEELRIPIAEGGDGKSMKTIDIYVCNELHFCIDENKVVYWNLGYNNWCKVGTATRE